MYRLTAMGDLHSTDLQRSNFRCSCLVSFSNSQSKLVARKTFTFNLLCLIDNSAKIYL